MAITPKVPTEAHTADVGEGFEVVDAVPPTTIDPGSATPHDEELQSKLSSSETRQDQDLPDVKASVREYVQHCIKQRGPDPKHVTQPEWFGLMMCHLLEQNRTLNQHLREQDLRQQVADDDSRPSPENTEVISRKISTTRVNPPDTSEATKDEKRMPLQLADWELIGEITDPWHTLPRILKVLEATTAAKSTSCEAAAPEPQHEAINGKVFGVTPRARRPTDDQPQVVDLFQQKPDVSSLDAIAKNVLMSVKHDVRDVLDQVETKFQINGTSKKTSKKSKSKVDTEKPSNFDLVGLSLCIREARDSAWMVLLFLVAVQLSIIIVTLMRMPQESSKVNSWLGFW